MDINLSTSRGDGNSFFLLPLSQFWPDINLSTSRGDGNYTLVFIYNNQFHRYKPIYLERGRKPDFLLCNVCKYPDINLSTSRGDGNNIIFHSQSPIPTKDINLSTSRGDGNSLCLTTKRTIILGYKPIYLERGRKQKYSGCLGFFLFSDINLSTSRGDGNFKTVKAFNFCISKI